MNVTGTKVFVSGGAGVIGHELIPMLHAAGAQIMVGDLKPRPVTWSSDIAYRQGDLNSLTSGEVEAFSPEVFIHLAATFERSTETPGFWSENFRDNVALSHHLMTRMKESSTLRRVVFASSYLVYDPALYTHSSPVDPGLIRPLKETDPIHPRNLTGTAKLSHEQELRFLNDTGSNFTSVSARIYRGYGRGSRDVISRWIRSLIKGETIDVYRPEGRFDFIYAAESAEGLMRLGFADDVTGIVNLGTGQSRQVSEVIAMLGEIFPGMATRMVESDIPYEASCADTSLLLNYIGWKPAGNMRAALDSMVTYERQREGAPIASVPRVLISSVSAKVPLLRAVEAAAAKLSSQAAVIAGDVNPVALAGRLAREFLLLPRTDDAHLPDLLRVLEEAGITAVVPTRDGELEFFARHRDTLAERGISVMVSGPAAIHACVDKLEFSRVCRERGISAIETFSSTVEANHVTTFVVKERFGAGSRSLGLGLARDAAEEWGLTLDSPIFQPMIVGPELSIDGYVTMNGIFKGAVARTRDEVVGGESRVTTVVRDEGAVKLARSLAAALNLRGHFVIQAIRSERGLEVIECNSRIGGASTLAFASGLDSLWWFLLEASGANVDDYPFIESAVPLRLIRAASDTVVPVSS
jgi:carbamoyl-phosphate synthase large subunit